MATRVKKIYLHIGCEKTGTTTIQRFLARNRESLKKRGVLYPESLGPFNHFDLSVYALDDDRITPTRLARRSVDFESMRDWRRAIIHDLVAEVGKSRAETVVLSSEQLSSKVFEAGEIERLKELLAEVGGEVELICYLRRQDDMVVSSYSSEIKAGRTKPFNWRAVSVDNVKYNFKRLLKLWAGGFERRQMNVRLFDRRALKDGDLLADFMDVLGIGLEGLEQPPPSNQSLDIYALEMLRLMNNDLPKHGGDWEIRGNLQNFMTQISDGPKMRMSSENAAAFLVQFQSSNDWVMQHYFPDCSFNPFAVKSDSQEAIDPTIDITTLALYAARLWKVKQNQLVQLRKAMNDTA